MLNCWAVEKWLSVCSTIRSPPPPRPPSPTEKQSFCPLNRIESTFNRIESSDQLLLVFLIENFLNNIFSIVIESTSIRLTKIANRNPLMHSSRNSKSILMTMTPSLQAVELVTEDYQTYLSLTFFFSGRNTK